MLSSVIFFTIALFIYGLIEFYGWQAIRTIVTPENVQTAKLIYWSFSAVLLFFFLSYRPLLYKLLPRHLAMYFLVVFVILLFSKLIVLLFLVPEDIYRGIRFVLAKFTSAPAVPSAGITRSEFISKAALVASAIPAGTLLYGIFVNAYNYRFHKLTLRFPNLPASFDGFKIIQLSDIHSGSFTQTEPIEKVIAQINAKNADLILFTGDLVNNVADEMETYQRVFDKLKAKHGVMSVTGNHDYGDYVTWDSTEEKRRNFDTFKSIHANMGWDLLMNENRTIERNGESIAILGVENWGTGTWTKYGKMNHAYEGVEDVPFKVLMSHNPQHWDAVVRPEYPDVDLTLSGHTHGAQFGIEEKWLRWSPVQYVYKQWAGLYQEGKQFLYVNRGFGFLGYPGRVGILPEITEITLQRS